MLQIHSDTLVVFTENPGDQAFLQNSLQEVFGDYLDIVCLNAAGAGTVAQSPPVVVATIVSREHAAEYFPGSRIVYATRTINGHNLERLIALPANTKILVANQPKAVAEETVSDLRAIGIGHLDLRPYWPGCEEDTTGYNTVVYTGYRSYCPNGKQQYIDIGFRHITQSTIVEIIQAYNLPASCIEKVSENYIHLIIQNCYKLEGSLRETERLKKNSEIICNLSANALITVDNHDVVTVFNPAAAEFLGMRQSDILGRTVQECFSAFPSLVDLIRAKKNVRDCIITINKRPVLTVVDILLVDQEEYAFISMMPVETLQGTEAKVRTKLHHKGYKAKYRFDDIVGTSAAMTEAKDIAKLYAGHDATILITGESGVGKELFAQSVHNASRRASHPFLGVNFAALTENLAESELFGYEEGAFTGASRKGKAGIFETAHMGTIFLDEIGDASLSMQTKLLRVLEEREVSRVGSTKVLPVNVRLICATNKDLPKMVCKGEFREDLYYRIRVLALKIPSLRERKEDIPSLVEQLAYKGLTLDKAQKRELIACLGQYRWPGNVRELKSTLQYLAIKIELSRTKDERFSIRDMIARYMEQNDLLDTAPAPDAARGFARISPGSLAVLREVFNCNENNRKAGRYSLAKCPALMQRHFTEAKIRSRLKELEEKGLVVTGKTKQGVRVTEAGMSLLGAERTSRFK